MNELWCPLEDMKKERLWYSIVTRDRYGKVVSRERRKSHSFLKQWNQLLYCQMGYQSIQIKDTNNVNKSATPQNVNFKVLCVAGETRYGLRIGTGFTAVDISDYALEIPIEQGVGAGQMQHGATTVAVYSVVANTCSFVTSRLITNNSGGAITVKETALYAVYGSYPYYGCFTRDVLAVPQAVPHLGTISIDWTIGVTA